MSGWRALADEWAARMIDGGGTGVALMGSHGRGDADPLSDVDIVAIGAGEADYFETDGVILSLSWTTVDEARALMDDPARWSFAVGGWRTAVPMVDPHGEVATLRCEAEAWTWTDERERTAAEWLASEVTHYCEEVFVLVRMLRVGRANPADVIRSVFALRCAGLVAGRFGVLFESEKDLWDLVADHQGPTWAQRQRQAFGTDGALAALDLYRLTAEIAAPDLTDHQRPVVEHALAEIASLMGTTDRESPA